ncbi:hypothetical protein PG995_007202 [Apiospora arundinis]
MMAPVDLPLRITDLANPTIIITITITTLVDDTHPENHNNLGRGCQGVLSLPSATPIDQFAHALGRPATRKIPQFPQIRPRTSRGSFDSSRSRSSTISSTSSTLSGDGLTSRKQPQERQRACEDCWKEFWG